MTLTFGDGAEEQYVQAVAAVPSGYTVALLADGEELPPADEIVPGADVRFLSADADGVTYMVIDGRGDPVSGDSQFKPWAEIARVHVY
jgi:hypothetical protein